MRSSHLGSPTIYPFYVISSDESIRSIYDDILAEYEKAPNTDELKKIALVRCIWLKGKETNYTLCVIDEDVYDQILDTNSMDIEKCRVSKHNAPSEDETQNLFIPLPGDLSLSQCRKIIDSMMSDLMLYKMWKPVDFTIVYPGKSRTDDLHTGKCFIYFKNKEESIEKIALTRMFIGGRMWKNTTREIKCHWMSSFERTPKRQTKKYIKSNTNIDTVISKDIKKSDNAWNKPLSIPKNETDES